MSSAKKVCIIGWPLHHTLSPAIHTYWLEHYGIDGIYEKNPIAPEDIDSFLENFKHSGYIGANVTIPYKENALRSAQHIKKPALEIGAANTLWLENDELHATNTDLYGFTENLNIAFPHWEQHIDKVMVLGAGGASRAIIKSMIDSQIKEIYLANRTFHKAEQLAQEFGHNVKPITWENKEDHLKDSQMLINTTSLGMLDHAELQINLTKMPKNSYVTDIVYTPLETSLLSQAKSLNHKTLDGLGMLLYQAVPGFQQWFGIKPEVTKKLREHVISLLPKRGKK